MSIETPILVTGVPGSVGGVRNAWLFGQQVPCNGFQTTIITSKLREDISHVGHPPRRYEDFAGEAVSAWSSELDKAA